MSRETKRPKTQTDGANLPQLTPKQLAFVQGILSGLTASDAYRAAYDAEKLPDTSIWVRAAEVKANSKVAVWLSQARLHSLQNSVVTLEGHTRELDRLSRVAEGAGAYGASIKAEELKGRANGLYVDRIKTDDGKIEVLQALKVIAQAQPDLGARLAELLDVPESDIMGNDKPSTPTEH